MDFRDAAMLVFMTVPTGMVAAAALVSLLFAGA